MCRPDPEFDHDISKRVELIFIDGGSIDRSTEIIKGYGRVVQCMKGGALQMHRGAKHAIGVSIYSH